jgi:glycine cleavage system H protein
MTAFLLALMVAAILLVEYLLHFRGRRAATSEAKPEQMIVADVAGIAMPHGLAYHPLHTWVRELDAQTVVIGLDDFARRLVGKVDKAVLPMTNVELEAGQGAALLRRGKRMAPIANPIAGEVIEVNKALRERPSLLGEDPYGAGWLYKLRSWRLAEQLGGLLGGSLARQWMELSVRRMKVATAGAQFVLAQDGGRLLDDIGSQLNQQQWENLLREHLGTEPVESD